MVRPIATVVLALALVACVPGAEREGAADDGPDAVTRSAASAQSPDTPVSNLDPIAPPPPATPPAKCPVVSSHGWSAAVIGKPPGSGDRLRVSGTLTLAEGGWRARLEQGPVLEIYPPIQQLELAFERTGADGPREFIVRGEFPALNEYGAIEIRCGARSVATITGVAWTENRIMEDDK